MALTSLDPKIALIVVDLQKSILGYPMVNPIREVVAHAGMLACAFRDHDLPVALVNPAGSPPGRTEHGYEEVPGDRNGLFPELNQQAGDYVVSRQTWGAFSNTGLELYLDAHGVTQVVIAGVATSISVESTARDAHALGFNVALAIDAMSDTSAEAHGNSISRIFPRLGEIGSTREVIDLLNNSRAAEKSGADAAQQP